MTKKKAGVMGAIILAIVFVIYNLVVFLAFKPVGAAFWISYLFMVIAFAAAIVAAIVSFSGSGTDAVFFGIPLMQYTIFYFAAEMFASLVFMFFRSFLGWRLPLVIQVLILGAFAVVAIIAVAARDTTKAVADDYKQKISALKELQVDAEMAAQAAADPALRARLQKLAESIRYSDPMYTPAVEAAENHLREGMQRLRYYCMNGDTASAMQVCANLETALAERNMRLKASK